MPQRVWRKEGARLHDEQGGTAERGDERQTWPVELDSHVSLVEHRLSAAAQAFKAQAFAAAGLASDVAV